MSYQSEYNKRNQIPTSIFTFSHFMSKLPMTIGERKAAFPPKPPKNPYRNALNREMKDKRDIKTNPNAIRYNHGKHWQEKYEPESSEYYTRLCDGNYHRIGNNMELPEHILGDDIIDMKEQISELEALLKSKSQKGIIEESIISDQVGKLIERSTHRYKNEAERYKESFYRARDRALEASEEIVELQNEIRHLKETGVFPLQIDPATGASDMKRRFANIGFIDTYTV